MTYMSTQPLDQSNQSHQHSKLTQEQALALLQRLSTDDAFRTRFEAKPAKALAEIGVALETIADLDPKCLLPSWLAGKDVLAQAAASLDSVVIEAVIAMRVPTARMR